MEISKEKLIYQESTAFLTKHYTQDYFTSPRHFHYEYEIAYIKQSNGKLYVGNNIVDFKPGNLFIFAPRLVHCFKNNMNQQDSVQKATATIIHFKRELLGISFLERKEAVLLNKLLTDAEAGILIAEPEKRIVSRIENLSFNEDLKSILDLLTILDHLSKYSGKKLLSARWVKKHYYQLKDELINKILEHIEANFAERTIFKEAVALSGMGTPSFSRYFKLRTEMTFTQYVNGVRVINAQKLLINSNMKVSDICAQCGFRNLSYFNRSFKRINNMTPRGFRDLYLGTNNSFHSQKR
ncbi:MAG: AraC family transcriptional regulator [Bacteroidota bacterium]